MPVQKVALVDVDGTLLIDGQLNPHMVAALKAGGFDQVWLFTQRGCDLTIRTARLLNGVPRFMNARKEPEATDFAAVTLSAVKDALSREGIEVQGISTSYDAVIPLADGSKTPGQYYETVVKRFDRVAITHAHFGGKASEYGVEVTNSLEAEKAPAVVTAIKDKNNQITTLLKEIIVRVGTRTSLDVTFFDDHPDNFSDISKKDGGVTLPENVSLRMVLATSTKISDQYLKECRLNLPAWFVVASKEEGTLAASLLSLMHRMSDARALLVSNVLKDLTPGAAEDVLSSLSLACREGGAIRNALIQPTTSWQRFCGVFATDMRYVGELDRQSEALTRTARPRPGK